MIQLSTFFSPLSRNPLLVSSLLGLVSFAVLLVLKTSVSLTFLDDISGSETSTILPIQLLLDGNPIYTNPEAAPFRFTQYTPIYFCVISFFYQLTDWTAEDVHKVFLTSRVFSMAFTLMATAVLGYLTYLISNRNKYAAILSALFFYHILATWLLTGSRPDSLLVLATASFLLTIYKALDTNESSEKWWYLASFLAISAFFVKQSGMIHTMAMYAFLLVSRQWKLLFKVALAGAVFSGLYLLILPINTFSVFLDNIVGGVANSTSFNWFYYWTLQKWAMPFALLTALTLVISCYHFFKPSTPFSLFLAIATPLFFGFATLTSLKIGAGVGYYQDYLLLAIVQIVAFIIHYKFRNPLEKKFGRSTLSVYLVFVYFYSTLFVFMTHKNVLYHNPKANYIEQRKVAEYLFNEKKLKKTDWVSLEADNDYFLRHFLFNQTLIPFKDLVYLADQNHIFDFSKFKSMVDRGEIRYVITDQGSTPKNILNYSYGNTLKLMTTVGPFDIYESKALQNIEL